jgi:hypothetical protein
MNGIGIELMVALGSAHVIGDYLLQNETVAANKHRLPVLTVHALGAGAAAYIACGLWRLWWIFALTALSHGLLDWTKLRTTRPRLRSFLLDQSAHLAVAACLALAAVVAADSTTIWPQLSDVGRHYLLRSLVLAAGLLMAGKVGGIVIGLWVYPHLVWMKRRTRRIGRRNTGSGETTASRPPMTEDDGRGLPQAGRIIGQMERLLIFMMVFSGEPGGIGFLVAAKSIFRFGELKDPSNRMEAEYILIGTLISFVYGIAVAYGAKMLWHMV